MSLLNMVKGIDERFIRRNARKVRRADVIEVQARAAEIEEVFSRGAFRKFLGQVVLTLGMIKDYWTGSYRRLPYWAIGAAVFTLLYVLNPLDLIPDFLLGVGQVDDIAVVSVCLYMIRRELEEYAHWRAARRNAPIEITVGR